MSIYEYNEEKHMQMEREEHYERGKEEGRVAELAGLVHDGILSLEQAAQRMSLSAEQFAECCRDYNISL